jgi:hypothetical protein
MEIRNNTLSDLPVSQVFTAGMMDTSPAANKPASPAGLRHATSGPAKRVVRAASHAGEMLEWGIRDVGLIMSCNVGL